tara:strand:+ start:1006 stop:1230 length:225 start_codon:yes stop_codon:yes gene_type:complete
MNTEVFKQIERISKERQQKLTEILEQMEESEPKAYTLDVSTIETLDDVKAILNGLDMVITEDSEHFESVKKYFK